MGKGSPMQPNLPPYQPKEDDRYLLLKAGFGPLEVVDEKFREAEMRIALNPLAFETVGLCGGQRMAVVVLRMQRERILVAIYFTIHPGRVVVFDNLRTGCVSLPASQQSSAGPHSFPLAA